jgi:hypothetical protein
VCLNNKQFYSYIKSKKQDASGISSLRDNQGYLHSEAKDKAEIELDLRALLCAFFLRLDSFWIVVCLCLFLCFFSTARYINTE